MNAELLQEVYETQMAGHHPAEVFRLVMPEFPDLEAMSDEDCVTKPVTDIERTVQDLGIMLMKRSSGIALVDVITTLYTGIALGYLVANREALDGQVPDGPLDA